MKPIVAIDFMSCLFPLVNSIQKHREIIQDIKQTLITPGITKRVCAEWVRFMANPELYAPVLDGFDPESALPILCLDTKNDKDQYWRHEYLSTYKSGRRTKSQDLMYTKNILLDEWRSQGLATLSQDGFEADDFAGAIARLSEPLDLKVMLVSVDSDWAQLVNNRITWLDIYPPSKRTGESQKRSVLTPDRVLERFNNQTTFKRTRLLNSPRDLVDHKHEFGDSSDKIPLGRVVDIGIIDLLLPTKKPKMLPVYNALWSDKIFIPHPQALTSPYNYGLPTWLEDF